MKKLYPDAVISYDLTGAENLEYLATFQGEEIGEIEALLHEQHETENADGLISFVVDCASCLDRGEVCKFEDLRGLRGDWLRLQWGNGGDYLIFKQLGIDLYSLYIVAA